MKTTKLFFMAALALTFAACSNDDNDFENPAQQPAEAQGIPFTATISMGGDKATTRALSENGSGLTATWTVDEEVALIHNGIIDKVKVASVDDNVATISGTITTDADGADVTVIFPYDAADGTTGNVKSDLLAAQDGTLTGTGGTSIAEKYDVRKGTGTLKVSGTASLNDDVELTNQFAIFKFTLQDLSAAAKSATEFKVSDGSGNVMTTVTSGSASSELYVALPVMAAGTYWFNATIDSKPYIAKATTAAATVAGTYYQTTVKMATIGDVILDNGKFAARSSTGTKVAMIAYLGSDNGESAPYNHGLALALSDANGGTACQWKTSQTDAGHTYKPTNSSFSSESGLQYNATHNSDTYPAFKAAIANNGTTAPTGCSAWFLASGYQWVKMANAAGGYKDLHDGFSSVGGFNLQSYWWSSTEYYGSNGAWYYSFDSGIWNAGLKDYGGFYVRACLAF